MPPLVMPFSPCKNITKLVVFSCMSVIMVVIIYMLDHAVDNQPAYGLDFHLSYSVRKLSSLLSPMASSVNTQSGWIDLVIINILSPYITSNPLKTQDKVSSIENALFMMETSGRGTLDSRQACAVESAAMRSGLTVHLVMFSSQLDLMDNTTCQLYMSNNNIQFFYVDVAALAKNTPLGKKILHS